ncbi:MAG: hypothetical protein LC704_00085 [Actinobacteria bacterium]|nr:hypothetical protein [Actinomycetota bacterium]
MPLEKRPERQPDPVHGPHRPEREDRHPRGGREPDKVFGLDVESMSPRAQVTTALAVIVPVALAGILLFALTNVGWIWFTFCWVIFPAFGLLVRGIAGLSEGRTGLSAGDGKERELLGALRQRGELTPAEVAMETSLSVAEADRILRELAEGGHLQIRVRGGGLSYSLWGREETGQLEDR